MASMVNCVRCQSQCGEAPVWDPRTGRLSWIDTEKPVLSFYEPSSGLTASAKSQWLIQSIGRRKKGGWISVVREGFAIIEHDPGKGIMLGNPIKGMAHMTMNDGTVGPDGRFYAGSLNVQSLGAPDGCLHRVDADGSIHTIETGLVLPNGMAFSPDGKILYVTEMWVNRIIAFDFDKAKGTVSRRRTLVKVPEEEGHPDGLIVDAKGMLWSGHWQGFRLTCYDPDGKKVRHVEVPVPTATCMAFGGRDLDELYITTAKKGLSPEQLGKYPEAGDLFMTRLDVQGRLEHEFAG
jgi:sugar lactone lactonase YvrE